MIMEFDTKTLAKKGPGLWRLAKGLPLYQQIPRTSASLRLATR